MYELPDGQRVSLRADTICSHVRRQAAEVGTAIRAVLGRAEMVVRAELAEMVVLGGGGAGVADLAEYLSEHLEGLPCWLNHDPQILPWLGGSLLAGLPLFEDISTTKQQYEEFGRTCIHRKCLL